jgi:hypothetical protein
VGSEYPSDSEQIAILERRVEVAEKALAEAITPEEFRAMALVIQDHAKLRGEDVIGSFMLTGGFHVLRGNKLVELATKVYKQGPLRPEELKVPEDGLHRVVPR